MLTIKKSTLDAMRGVQLVKLKRDVIAHARRKIALKVSANECVMAERLELAFDRTHAFLSARETDHYDSYVYLTLSLFLIDDAVSNAAIQCWLSNELISPITRARTLYLLVKKTLREGR